MSPATLIRQRPKYPIVPFDDNVPTHPLLVVDYALLKQGDEDEIATLYKACSTIGFFYLKNLGVDPEPMFEVGEDTFELPIEELMKYEQGDSGMSAGFKYAGSTNTDKEGNLDTAFFLNLNKHDALNFPEVFQRGPSYPAPAIDAMESTVKPFVRACDDIGKTIMRVLEPKLGLPAGTFDKLHTDRDVSGSEVRVIRKPAEGEAGYRPEGTMSTGEKAASIGAHTDFGSLSILHGRGTGGLQVLVPGSETWQNIKPLPGHAVCNVGDTLSVYSGGLFRSNIHRVVPPPPPQHQYTRYSLVMFVRPSFEAELYPLSHLSEVIKKAQEENETMRTMEKGITAGAWFKRRVMGQRAGNRKGPESWEASRGTEHTPQAA